MTGAERQAIRAAVDQARREKLLRADPAVFDRVLAACCPDSTVDVEAHARRIALRVARAQSKAAA